MPVERIDYQAGETACTGALVYDDRVSGPRPLLLMSPNWLGVSDDSIKRAATIAGSRYVAFVVDMSWRRTYICCGRYFDRAVGRASGVAE